MSLDPAASVFVAGHRGMVGSALVRALEARGQHKILTAGRAELDLCNQAAVEAWFESQKPQVVVVAAAKVGGIHANFTYPAEFLYENLMIAANCIHAAYRHGVQRLLFLGSSCIYPREAPQPMREEALLSSELELTNEAYAIAKIAGLKLCQYYRKQYGVLFHSAMPTNLYGPGDNYHPENSHVIPGLIRRFHEAKTGGAEAVSVWGTGSPRREFLHADDLAEGCVHLLGVENPPDWVNIGCGEDITIRALAELVKDVVGFEGELKFDSSKPDGTPRKLMETSKMKALGWQAKTPLREGLVEAYESFQAAQDN
ncbi:GDP-L-fucose synthase [Roseimicrobium gellanilyticum]|uniref:GDP-L-fucose synthase n=1 Tax=Roseimicrobium gellanilyticum TaxID=748857 RepID=A0A366HBJ6_9BACT|nr:GDP-L-fucose synthase [Roseimicrobium gellanilyticum]RBP39742.1 GDP-L-fucose synthase [Roseimicrobium gellanilyticum]